MKSFLKVFFTALLVLFSFFAYAGGGNIPSKESCADNGNISPEPSYAGGVDSPEQSHVKDISFPDQPCVGDGYIIPPEQLLLHIEQADLKSIKTCLTQNHGLINKFIKGKDSKEITPLIAALLYAKNMEIIQMMVEDFGADVNQAAPDGRTPLVVSLTNNTSMKKVTSFLIGEGAFSVNLYFSMQEEEDDIDNKNVYWVFKEYPTEQVIKDQQKRWSETQQQIEETHQVLLDQELKKLDTQNERDIFKKELEKKLEKEIRLKKLETLRQDLQTHRKKNNPDTTDGEPEFFVQLTEATIPHWQSITMTPFMQQLLLQQQTEDQNFSAIVKKYIKIVFFIYDTLFQESYNFQCPITEIIEKTNKSPCMVNAHQSIESNESDMVSVLTVDQFKQGQSRTFLTKNKTLRKYLDNFWAVCTDMPKELLILAHAYVWIGGDLSGSETMSFFLKKAGFLDKQVSFLNLGTSSEKFSLSSELIDLINEIKTKYPAHADNFIALVQYIYEIKIQLLTEIMHDM